MNSAGFLVCTLLGLTLLSCSGARAEPSAVVDVNLSPAGSFKGKTSDVKGSAVLNNGEVVAKDIKVNLRSLKTTIALRDKHTLKHLQADKYPEAVLVMARGKNGKGVGKIRIRGIERKVTGTYKVVGNELEANFKVHLPDFKITGIKYLGIGVQDDVTIYIKVPITKEAAPRTAVASTAKPAAAGTAPKQAAALAKVSAASTANQPAIASNAKKPALISRKTASETKRPAK